MSDKSEATRLADALDAYGITSLGESNLRKKAAALLRRWPDGERIAALEAALEQARVALRELQYARTDIAVQLTVAALGAIEEVKR